MGVISSLGHQEVPWSVTGVNFGISKIWSITCYFNAKNAARCSQFDQQLRTMCEEQENRRENRVG